MDGAVELTRSARRLKGELIDDGIALDADDPLRHLVLDELDYARRPPVFERRVPLYGSILVPDDRSLISAGELVDLVPLDDHPLADARRFADGRSTYLARRPDGGRALACFRRSVQYEADMVQVQADTGAYIVQRTPVLNVTRLFTPTSTVEWAGYRWTNRPNARAEGELLRPQLPDVAPAVLGGLLELAIHWLSPGRTGATLVLPGRHGDAGLDFDHSVPAPRLSITTRHHYPAMLAALMQTDLACVIRQTGPIERIGVALRPSPDAGAAVEDPRGMRHRSAARYTWDHPGALAVVVSEDGPVTVFRGGQALSESAAAAVPAPAVPPG
ncbi:MAG TPA: DNA integrity scanning protein DisA nucleotide-binding domain protein [Acidimicrobiales bacterium]|nr:DNA integrity scanning protein DisA nucleotide-binding domain protein [Acidimicrobiales bacterium]